jgi:hypothetical protein
VTAVCLLRFLNDLSHPAWWPGAVALVALTALIVWERRSASPLIDVRSLARNAALRGTYLRQMLVGLGMYAAMYSVTQWLQGSAGYSSSRTGLIMLPMSVAAMGLARLVSRRGWVRLPLLIGSLALVGGGLLMTVIHHGTGPVVLLVTTGVLGVPNGLCNFANQATLYVGTTAQDIGVAAGLLRTFGYIGAIFSSSVISLSFGHHVSDQGFHRTGWVVLALGALTALVTLLERTVPATVARGGDNNADSSDTASGPPARGDHR